MKAERRRRSRWRHWIRDSPRIRIMRDYLTGVIMYLHRGTGLIRSMCPIYLSMRERRRSCRWSLCPWRSGSVVRQRRDYLSGSRQWQCRNRGRRKGTPRQTAMCPWGGTPRQGQKVMPSWEAAVHREAERTISTRRKPARKGNGFCAR